MELRILNKEIWVSKGAQKGWGAKSITQHKKTLQFKNEGGDWTDVPERTQFIDVTEKGTVYQELGETF